MSPPALSWWQLLDSPPVLRTGMLCLAGAGVRTEARSSSESLLLELASLLEDEELLESEELSPLLSWSMTRASAINSAHASTRKAQEHGKMQPRNHRRTCARNPNQGTHSARLHLSQCRPWGNLERPSPWEGTSWSWGRTCCCCCCCHYSSSAGPDDWSAAPAESGSYCCLQLCKPTKE